MLVKIIKVWLVLSVICMLFLITLSSCTTTDATGDVATEEATAEKENLKMAFIYNGPIGDMGWTWNLEQGRQYLEETLDYVETTYLESIPEGPDSEKVIFDLANEGYDIINAASFGYQEFALKVAEDFPDTIFLISTGDKVADNVESYYIREYEGGYIQGVLAALLTETNTIGAIGSYPIPATVQEMNSYLIGGRTINPNLELRIIWLNSWYDPPGEQEAASSFADLGMNVILSQSNSPAPQQVAEENGIYSFGSDNDLSKFAPNSFVTGTKCEWGKYFVTVTEEVYNGTWEPKAYWGHIGEVYDIWPLPEFIPEDIANKAMTVRQDIIDGKIDVFKGPLYDNEGNLRVDEGESMKDEDIRLMDWLVDGVIAQ